MYLFLLLFISASLKCATHQFVAATGQDTKNRQWKTDQKIRMLDLQRAPHLSNRAEVEPVLTVHHSWWACSIGHKEQPEIGVYSNCCFSFVSLSLDYSGTLTALVCM